MIHQKLHAQTRVLKTPDSVVRQANLLKLRRIYYINNDLHDQRGNFCDKCTLNGIIIQNKLKHTYIIVHRMVFNIIL